MKNVLLVSAITVLTACAQQEDQHAGHNHAPSNAAAATDHHDHNHPPPSASVPAGVSRSPVPFGHPGAGGAMDLASTVLDPARVADANSRDAYVKAREVADRLDQMYCYCHCNRQLGHKSLLTCFQDDHAIHCAICKQEAVQAWMDSRDGLPVEASQRAADFAYNRGAPPPIAQ